VVTAVGTVVVVVVVVDVVLVDVVLVELVSTVTAGACVVVVVSALTNAGVPKPRDSTTREVAKMVRRIDSTLLTESPCRTAVVQRY
jgi:hypothetical protein